MKQKQAQLLTQPLFLIFAMIIGALILYFGYQAITDITGAAGATAVQDWTQQLNAKVREMSFLDVGSSTTITIQLPNEITHICIKSVPNPGAYPPIIDQPTRTLINGNPNQNVIFLPIDAYDISLLTTIQGLSVTSPIECYPNGIQATLQTTTGGTVLLKSSASP